MKYSFEQVYADMKKEHLGVIEAACDILGEESCQKFIKNEAETLGKFVDEHPVALQDDSADDLPERFHTYICSTLLIEATSIKLCRLVEEVWFRKLPRVVSVTFANTLSLYKKSEFSICNELKYNQDKFVETWNKHTRTNRLSPPMR